MTVSASAVVLLGSLLMLLGVVDVSSHPEGVVGQHDWLVIVVPSLLMAIGSLLVAAAGDFGAALSVLCAAAALAQLLLPGDVSYHGPLVVFHCLVTNPLAAAVTLRVTLAPQTRIGLLTAGVFGAVLLFGSLLLDGLVAASPIAGAPTHSLLVYLSSLALLGAPVMLWLAGRPGAAACVLPFAIVPALFVAMDNDSFLPWVGFGITGPIALATATYAMFTSHR